MCYKLSNDVASKYIFPRKNVLYSGNVCTETRPASIVHLSTFLFDISALTSFMNTCIDSTLSQIAAMSDHAFQFFFVKIRWRQKQITEAYEILRATHEGQCSGPYECACTLAKVQLEVQSISSTAPKIVNTGPIIISWTSVPVSQPLFPQNVCWAVRSPVSKFSGGRVVIYS